MKDQQLQILTAIIPLLPTLQKVPLHIASTEANLKEAIRKSAAPPIVSAQSTRTGSNSGPGKRKPSKNADQYTPSPSATKRKRMRIDPSCTAQQQLPSPKSSHDSLLTQGGLPTTNHHRAVGDALRSGSRPASGSVNTIQTPNPGQRLSVQPPTPMILPATPSRRQSIFLSERLAQSRSSVPHQREGTLDASFTPSFVQPVSSAHSATPVPSYHLNHSKDAFKLPTQFHIHTPLHAGPGHPNSQSTKPSAPPSVGFSAVRCPTNLSPSCACCLQHFFLPCSDEGSALSQSPMTTTKSLTSNTRKTTGSSFLNSPKSFFAAFIAFIHPISTRAHSFLMGTSSFVMYSNRIRA